MPNYYSQNGEDIILWEIFADKEGPGFFVEVGALDGKRFSNTYSFELAGWRGVCIEPHEYYFELLKRNRPNSVCIRAAISDREAERIEFYANRRGALSTLNPELERFFIHRFRKYFSGFTVQYVRMRTLDGILEEIDAPVPIDFISIDVEGHEVNVLKGFDLERWSPRVLLIEAMLPEEKVMIENIMKNANYFKARELGGNLFFCKTEKDVEKIVATSIKKPLIHTPHPLDRGKLRATKEGLITLLRALLPKK